MIQFDIITIFPHIFDPYFNSSIIARAQKKNLIKIKIHNLRDFTTDKHRTVDDKPYGGGPGMILKIAPIYRSIFKNKKLKIKNKKSRIILLTPKGKRFNQKIAYQYSKLGRLILICGHYEGIDARVEKFCDEKISVGPYVLTGGELPAMIIVDTATRLIPGVIKKESLLEESFSCKRKKKSELEIRNLKLEILHEYPQYTRPEVFTYKNKSGKIKDLKIPKILLSGNHQKIQEWRRKMIRKIKKLEL